MGKYRYRALGTDNEKIEGKYEARSKEEVMSFISGNGMYPLMVEEIIQSKEVKFGNNRKVKVKDIAVMSRQFYTMLDAGVPILECLNILSSQIENKKLRQAISETEDDVKKGAVLSDSLKKHEKIFPPLFTSLITSGEASGKLDTVMLRMADYYEKQSKIANKVKSAMIYPIVLAIMCLGVTSYLLVGIMPTFAELFESNGNELFWSTRFLLALSDFVIAYWIQIIIGAIIVITGIKVFFNSEKGKVFKSQLKLKLPVLKTLNSKIIVSQFTRTLSTLIASGIPLIESLDIVSGVVQNKIAESSLRLVGEKVSRGEGLNSSIEEAEIFPNMLCSMVKIGEETGALDDILNKTADFYDEELEAQIQATVSLMEPVLIVVMGIIIGFIVISIMVPMFDSYSQI